MENKIEWSKEQEKIIDGLRDVNVLVAAAAGSGKTTVLVERIKKLVCYEGVPVKNLLVVTFTKAAAAEMKEKIRKALRNELKAGQEGDKEQAAYLRKQLRDIAAADISTFDSFALNVVRRYFFKTDLEPGFGVLDEARKVLMVEDALDRLLDEEFSEMRPEFIRFMNKYCSDRKPDKIRSLISNTYTRIMAMPHPWQWMEEQVAALRVDKDSFAESKYWLAAREDITKSLEKSVVEGMKAADYLRNSSLDRMATNLEEGEIAKHKNALLASGEDLSPEELVEKITTALKPRTSLVAKKEEKETYNAIKDAVDTQRDKAKEYVKGIKDDFFATPIPQMIDEMNDTADELETVIGLLKRFHRLFKEAKEEAKMIDFADMEHYCLEILEDPQVAEEYRNRFSQIFIDEYQDTNLLQEAIVDLIRRENNLFMVGDVKQSIYKFRLAEPAIFQDKYNAYYEKRIPFSEVVDLNQNFRSKGGIIKGVNRVFSDFMEGYDERAELHKGVKYDGEHTYYPEIRVAYLGGVEGLTREDDEESKSADENGNGFEGDEVEVSDPTIDTGAEEVTAENLEKAEIEAALVARLVKEQLGKPYYDPGKKTVRELEPRDIVILLRSVKGYGEVYSDALSALGIESYTSETGGYFDTMEIEIFMNLLSILDNRRRDVELISVLHSHVFGFTPTELGEIRRHNKKGAYVDAFFEYGEKGEIESLKDKCKKAINQIDEWRNASRVMPLPKFIWKVMNESGFYLVMGAMPGGAVRQANLRALVDKAESFAQDRQASLYSFVKYVGELRKRQVTTPEVKLVGEGDQVVRIMTIHKSKGLEFPMVILAGAGRNLRYSNRGQDLVFHREIGIGMNYVNYEESWYRNTLPQTLIFRRIREEEEEEQERVLYVALTRAKDYLFVTGTVDEAEEYEAFRDLGTRDHSSFLKMIGDALPLGEEVVACVDGDSPEEEPAQEVFIKEEMLREAPDPKRAEKIYEQLSSPYAYEEARKNKSKVSVSELNAMRKKAPNKDAPEEGGTAETGSEGAYTAMELGAPDFAREKRTLTGAEKGTIYHSLMEYVDFSLGVSEGLPYIQESAETMVKEGLITEEELKAIDLTKVEGFFLSDLGKRAAAAFEKGLLHKERPFTLREKQGKEDILVQGIIDCYFKEDGRTILLDYKSNRIKSSSPESYSELLDNYRTQLDIYREALEKAGEGPVEEVYLYLFSTGEAIKA